MVREVLAARLFPQMTDQSVVRSGEVFYELLLVISTPLHDGPALHDAVVEHTPLTEPRRLLIHDLPDLIAQHFYLLTGAFARLLQQTNLVRVLLNLHLMILQQQLLLIPLDDNIERQTHYNNKKSDERPLPTDHRLILLMHRHLIVEPRLQIFNCIVLQLVIDAVANGNDFIHPFADAIRLATLYIVIYDVVEYFILACGILYSQSFFPILISFVRMTFVVCDFAEMRVCSR